MAASSNTIRFRWCLSCDTVAVLKVWSNVNSRRHKMPGKSGPRHWRDIAKETRAKAGKATSPRSKRLLLGLASSYDRLAKQIWRRSHITKKSK
jgi:hypothetical protein